MVVWACLRLHSLGLRCQLLIGMSSGVLAPSVDVSPVPLSARVPSPPGDGVVPAGAASSGAFGAVRPFPGDDGAVLFLCPLPRPLFRRGSSAVPGLSGMAPLPWCCLVLPWLLRCTGNSCVVPWRLSLRLLPGCPCPGGGASGRGSGTLRRGFMWSSSSHCGAASLVG